MFSKIYLAALGLSIAVMAFFTYYSWSWLQSIGQPAAAVAGYEYHSNLAWITLWITSMILLLLGNAVLWTTRSAWALWLAVVYFAAFVIIKYFWLAREFMRFSETPSSFPVIPFIAVGLVILMATVVFLDSLVVVRLLASIYPDAKQTDIEPKVDID
ncbi:MAG: hypothetical protein WBD16_04490 [Pyrinomonadaceae bacterium]